MPGIAIASGDGFSACGAVVDGEVQCDGAVATGGIES